MFIDCCVLLEESRSICGGLSIVPCVSTVTIQLGIFQILCTVCFGMEIYVDSQTKKRQTF